LGGVFVANKQDRQGRLLHLVDQVYEAALDDKLWSGLAREIARTFDSPSTALQIRKVARDEVELLGPDREPAPIGDGGIPRLLLAARVWVDRALELGMSRVVASSDMISDAEVERTEFWQDWSRKVDQFYIVGAMFPVAEAEIGGLWIHRPRASGTYEEDDKHQVGLFLPHLQRALQVRRRLAAPGIAHHATLDALERTGTATLVASRDGRILYANRLAEAVLRNGDAIRVIGGRLATIDRSATERLTMLVRDAATPLLDAKGASCGALSIARADRLPLTLLVAPFRPERGGFGAPEPAAIILIRDQEWPTPAASALQGLFGLTPTESVIASAIADGRSIEAIAAAQRITTHTARAHLKKIFAKTGTNRQSQLVAVLLRSAAVLGEK
jgi:DNA-binding CsgD family transcriptional regulator/PAS domain-containing protein